MRRDYFALDVSADDGEMPTARIDYEGPTDLLTERLTDHGGEPLSAEDVDVAYRLRGDVDDEEATGVVSVTNRVTGEFIVELNADATTVYEFIDAAREYGKRTGDDSRYAIGLTVDGEQRFAAKKSTFLVYDAEGELRRGRSLIPSGVEL